MRHFKNSIFLLLALVFAVSPFSFAAYENVAIYYNGEQLVFPDSGAYYDAQAECVILITMICSLRINRAGKGESRENRGGLRRCKHVTDMGK